MYQIGVDIGGTNIKIGLVDDSLEILEQASIPFPHEGAQTVADRLAEAVRGVLSAAGVKAAELQSIGVVIPGSIDPTGEVVINAYNLGFHDVPFKKLIAAHFPNTPIFMANDANGAALAELYKGAFVGCRTAVLLTLGTGLGGGIILNGKMFTGGNAALIDAKMVVDCAKAGDVTAKRVFDEYIGHLSSACASFFNILDPEVIAIGGGLCGAGEFLFAPLRERITEKCFYKSHGAVVPAVMGNDAGIIGEAMPRRDTELR